MEIVVFCFFFKDGIMVETYTSLSHLMLLCSPHVFAVTHMLHKMDTVCFGL